MSPALSKLKIFFVSKKFLLVSVFTAVCCFTKRYFWRGEPLSRGCGRSESMPYCPECGGNMRYISLTKRYVCRSCGLTLTYQELIEMRDRLKGRAEPEDEERRKLRKEYLQWWLSKKK
jgi:hypothetical protein